MFSISIAAAVNDDKVLESCLANSPDIKQHEVTLRAYRGYRSAAQAYNDAIRDCDTDFLVLVHQDVYLPDGFVDKVRDAISELNEQAPDWAICGVVGADKSGRVHGKVWSSGLQTIVAGTSQLPVEIETLDELLMIMRMDRGLKFDTDLPGYHLYAADIIQIAASKGFSSWVIDAPVVHHDRPLVKLDWSYKKAWFFMRRKWRKRLPLANLVCPITPSPITVWDKDLRIRVWRSGKYSRPEAEGDPVEIARQLKF